MVWKFHCAFTKCTRDAQIVIFAASTMIQLAIDVLLAGIAKVIWRILKLQGVLVNRRDIALLLIGDTIHTANEILVSGAAVDLSDKTIAAFSALHCSSTTRCQLGPFLWLDHS